MKIRLKKESRQIGHQANKTIQIIMEKLVIRSRMTLPFRD